MWTFCAKFLSGIDFLGEVCQNVLSDDQNVESDEVHVTSEACEIGGTIDGAHSSSIMSGGVTEGLFTSEFG